MTQAIDATGNAVASTSNLTHDNDFRAATRNVDAERQANGHFARSSNYISDDDANNNIRVVTRDGSRQYVEGGYQPTDIIKIEGMEVPYETAVSLGLIQPHNGAQGDQWAEPQEHFEQPLGAQPQEEQSALDGANLLHAQLELAVGGNADAVLATFGDDIVTNGEISEEGFRYAQDKLGMSEGSARALYDEMQESGSQTLADFMEVGDSLGMERMEFLVELAERGNRDEQAIVRNLWFQAATGKLTREGAAEAFDYLYAPYA
ncbi:hypothetical protein R5H32_02695 [Defluviimonas sp. D31]|uniref:hypothetical protein n=1 Tax=Defluviimonas sp. D31 TaxID=3083253 RepID=UPI00296EDB52|nr:hypothetical protein [Defluviimonas sp. D31]MDW4548256.1 hypothetical protein [Defluviimonas sp. D31]